MPGGGQCVFNSDWLLDDAKKIGYKVLKAINVLGIVNCAAERLKNIFSHRKKSIVPAMQHGCRAKPLLASMGKAALKSHMDGTRHQAHFSASVKSVPIARSFFSREEISQVAPLTSTNDNVTEVRAVQSLPDLCTLSKKVADAEILWALKCVNSHFWSK